MNKSVRGVDVKSRTQDLHSQLLNDSLSVSGITRTSRKFIHVRRHYERKISDESQSDKIFMAQDTKKCNDKRRNSSMFVLIKSIHFRKKSFTCQSFSIFIKISVFSNCEKKAKHNQNVFLQFKTNEDVNDVRRLFLHYSTLDFQFCIYKHTYKYHI